MADALTTQHYDGARNYTIKLVDISDGTGLSLVKVVDVTTMNPNPGVHLKVRKIQYTIHSGAVILYWEATTNVPIVFLAEGTDMLDFSKVYAGGYPNNAGTGVTGNILLSTVAFAANSGFSVELELLKGVALT